MASEFDRVLDAVRALESNRAFHWTGKESGLSAGLIHGSSRFRIEYRHSPVGFSESMGFGSHAKNEYISMSAEDFRSFITHYARLMGWTPPGDSK